MGLLRREVILNELAQQGLYIAMDGRLLKDLTADELEVESERIQELLGDRK